MIPLIHYFQDYLYILLLTLRTVWNGMEFEHIAINFTHFCCSYFDHPPSPVHLPIHNHCSEFPIAYQVRLVVSFAHPRGYKLQFFEN